MRRAVNFLDEKGICCLSAAAMLLICKVWNFLLQSGDGKKPWFYIGATESFEKKLEQEQLDMEMNRANFVEVSYKKE